MSTFPGGPGVAQGGGAGRTVDMGIHEAVVANEPESDGPSAFSRPQPTDPGGTNTAGWVKTKDYDDATYSTGGGPWKQV